VGPAADAEGDAPPPVHAAMIGASAAAAPTFEICSNRARREMRCSTM
jgi:hypothetical protein